MNPLILERKGSQSKTLVDAVNFQSFASDHLAHFEESDKNTSVSPFFEKPSGTSKSPEGTKKGDKYASGGPGRPASVNFCSERAKHLPPTMTDALSYGLIFFLRKNIRP